MPTLASPSNVPLNGHLWHMLLFAAWVPLFGLFLLHERLAARRRLTQPARARDAGSPLVRGDVVRLRAIAVASLCAAAPHVFVIREHLDEWVWYGLFFMAAAAGQILFALSVLIRPTRLILWAGLVGSTLVLVLWLATRTAGLPFGPDLGRTEPIGALDAIASAAELCTAVLAGVVLRGRPRRHPRRQPALSQRTMSRPVA